VWHRTTPLRELHQIPRAVSFVPKWLSDSTCNCKLNEQKDTLQVLSHFCQYFLKLWYGELCRQSCLNLYECSLKKLKNIIMRSFEISKKSTAFIPARQTDKSCWKTLPCHRLKYRWNRQLSFLRDRPTSLAEILYHVFVVWNIDEIDSFHSCETDRQVWIYVGAYWIRWNMSSFRTLTFTQPVNGSSEGKLIYKKTDLPTLWLHSCAGDNYSLWNAITFSLGLGQRADRPTHFCQLNKQDHSIRKYPSDRPHLFRLTTPAWTRTLSIVTSDGVKFSDSKPIIDYIYQQLI
jgi:hypothetical protein